MMKPLLLIALGLPLFALAGEPASHPSPAQAVQAGATAPGGARDDATAAEDAEEDIAAEVEEDQEIIKESGGSAEPQVTGAATEGGEVKPAIRGALDELKGGVEVLEDKPARAKTHKAGPGQ
jgi:hypothetical protein